MSGKKTDCISCMRQERDKLLEAERKLHEKGRRQFAGDRKEAYTVL